MQETGGVITKYSLLALSKKIWGDEKHSYSHKDKIHIYIANFVKFLAQDRDDPLLASLLMYFRKPKRAREKKMMTSRIIVSQDIANTIGAIEASSTAADSKMRHVAFILFLAYSGQRPSTAARLTVGQFRKALAGSPPVLKVEAKQDKIKMEHLVPLHTMIVPRLEKLIKGRQDSELMFSYSGVSMWFKRNPQPMVNTVGNLTSMDMRKYFEQKSDELGFTDANKNFIMTHGCSSVNWKSYKAFLPKTLYASYMKYWGAVEICPSLSL